MDTDTIPTSEYVEELTYKGDVIKVGMHATVVIPKRSSVSGRISVLKSSGWVGIQTGPGAYTEGFFLPFLSID